MPITVIVGGQLGSEGKGKVTSEFVRLFGASLVVRVGGTNAGHTFFDGDNLVIHRQLPTTHNLVPSVLCAGSYIDMDILMKEVGDGELYIDPYAVIVTDTHKMSESRIKESIGSTGSGVGSALIDRVARSSNLVFAKDVGILSGMIRDTVGLIDHHLKHNERIVIEGSQGSGLSLLHSQSYPYATSRDTNAAGILSEVGASPLDVDRIVMVIRSYPIRVAGNSGPMTDEISWKDIGVKPEKTSVSRRIRRVSLFDQLMVRRAISLNRPTDIVLNHLDYIDPVKRASFVNHIESVIGSNINYVGLDPRNILDRSRIR